MRALRRSDFSPYRFGDADCFDGVTSNTHFSADPALASPRREDEQDLVIRSVRRCIGDWNACYVAGISDR